MNSLRVRAGLALGVCTWWIFCGTAVAHKQHVHQYIVTEGYALLSARAGMAIPQLHDHVGDLTAFYAGDSAWQRPFITTGAWREDEEDVVFHHDSYRISPGLNYALTSISHFWDADQGDLVQNVFRLQVENPPLPPVILDIGPYENAYEKLMKFSTGGWVLWYPRSFLARNPLNGHQLAIAPLPVPTGFGVPIAYDGLTSFFLNRSAVLRSDQTGAYEVFDLTAIALADPKSISEIIVETEVRDAIVWEVLGRMCHLLADMSVPAHTHRDEHGLNLDSYEEFAGGTGTPYAAWDHTNCGPVLDPYVSEQDRLHFLLYVTQQVADHFGSNGPADGEGNDLVTGNPRSAEESFLDSLSLGTLGPPTTDAGPWVTESLTTILNTSIPLAIRATAGLLYWFGRETGLISPLVDVRPIAGADPVSRFSLEQNYPNPFNPRTTIGYTLPTRAFVRVSVFDLLGREISILEHEWRDAGLHTVEFDASGLSSGTYFYRLQAGDFLQSKRLVLLK